VRAERQAVHDNGCGVHAVEFLGGGPVRLGRQVEHSDSVVGELRNHVVVEERLLRRRQRRVHVIREYLEEGLGPLAGTREDGISAHVALRRADEGRWSGRQAYAELWEAVERYAYAHGGRVRARASAWRAWRASVRMRAF
jgi:hypothetical protein